MFCPKCGSILMPNKGKGKKKILQCSCGYSDEDTSKSVMTETVKKTEEIEIVEADSEEDMLPITEAECPVCGNNECRYWLIQTRASDEPETKFLKCTKCKHTFRDYC